MVDRKDLKKIAEEQMGLVEITASWKLDIRDDQDNKWLEYL